ncbi:class I tRNA ligase family protein [Patescibacteria group bacterium]|nr:class I tRNA ligase family protein [Patescibacteria group bacterium]
MPNGFAKSFGQCSIEEKYLFDHRQKATKKLIAYLENNSNNDENKIESLIHKTIKKVSEDIDNLKFNTAISQLMILANEIEKEDKISSANFKIFLNLLSPFVPHITEEIWKNLDERQSIHLQTWPQFNPQFIKDTEINFVIQINGKLRDQIIVPTDISKEEAKKLALESEKVQKWVAGKEIRKVFFVKGRLVNIVI